MRYSTSATALGSAGRKVRCASCGHNWSVDAKGEEAVSAPPPSEAVVEPPPIEAPEPELRRDPKVAQVLRAKREVARQQQRKKRNIGIWSGIAASFALLLTAAWMFRVEMVHIWPNTASVYAGLGAPVNYYEIEIENISAVRQISSGANILQISGQLRNSSKKTQGVPLLQAKMLEPDGTLVFSWVIEATQTELEAGAVLEFASELRDPPPGALNFEISFINEASTKADADKDA